MGFYHNKNKMLFLILNIALIVMIGTAKDDARLPEVQQVQLVLDKYTTSMLMFLYCCYVRVICVLVHSPWVACWWTKAGK
jgi:hypothetical protein